MVILKKNVFSIIEFASSKILCVIFQLSNDDIKILGFGYEISQGIRNGVVSDIGLAVKSIGKAVSKAESQYGKIIEDVYVVISGCGIESQIITQEALVNGRDITEKDIRSLTNRAIEKLQYGNDRAIMHSVNNGYAIDGIYVENPIGMYANKIDVSTNFVSVNKSLLVNIGQVFAKCRLNVIAYLAAPYMDSFSCISDDDKNIGVTVINFGAEDTGVLTFKNSCLTSCYTRPLGSYHITHDIAYAFGVSIANAEKMKLLYGNLFLDEEDNESISVRVENSGIDEIFIDKNEFLSVVLARQEEILELIFSQLNKKNSQFSYDISTRKIIIVGGGSKISGLSNMIGEFYPCKLVKDIESFYVKNIDNNFTEFSKNEPGFSSVFGAIKYLQNIYKDRFNSENRDRSRGFDLKRIFSFLKK
jgi:cell division protein FtsA